MSITINYFFNHDSPLDHLSTNINVFLGTNFKIYMGDPSEYSCRFMGIECDLCCTCIASDFYDYKYKISMHTIASNHAMREIQIETMSLIAYTLFHSPLNVNEGLLLYDGDIKLAKYILHEDTNIWYDEISEMIVDYPEHFEKLRYQVISRTVKIPNKKG